MVELKAQCVTFKGTCWHEIRNAYVCFYLDKATKHKNKKKNLVFLFAFNKHLFIHNK